MTPASAAYPDDFEEQVRDLLANLYDYLKLVNNPVARRLGADSTGAERASAARGMVFQAIEAMKSDSGASPPKGRTDSTTFSCCVTSKNSRPTKR